MQYGSLCGLGGMTPFPVMSALKHFPGRLCARSLRTRFGHMYALTLQGAGTPAANGEPVTLNIDGAEVTVPAGTSVMRAAAAAGGAIPKLCATDTLKAFGSCRVCLVEIEGQRGLPGLVHDARGAGHEGAGPKARSCASCAEAWWSCTSPITR